MSPDTTSEREAADERRFWRRFRQVLWTSLIGLGVLGLLVTASLLLGWGRYVVLAVLGLLAGLALALALMGSPQSRHLTGLLLGGVTLPVLAAHLGAVAIRSEAEFLAYGDRLLPFLAWAAAAALGVPWVARIWRARPEDAAAPGTKGAPP